MRFCAGWSAIGELVLSLTHLSAGSWTMANGASQLGQDYQLQGFIGGVWNPEDMVGLPRTSWIVVSGMRGADRAGCLFAVDSACHEQARALRWRSQAEAARVSPAHFDPHGIAARRLEDGRFELLVVDHGGGEAIDRLLLDLDDQGPIVVSGERIVQPPKTSANAVAQLPDGGFVMTSMFDPNDPETLAKFSRAEPTGRVWRWSPEGGWCCFGDLSLSGANGIAVADDGRSIIVCEWAAQRVWRLDAAGRPVAQIRTDFLPDNLRWTSDGQLLLAGQTDRPKAVFGCIARGARCPMAYKVVRLDPVSLTPTPLIAVDEQQAARHGFGGATGAMEIGGSIWVGSFTGERIAIFSRSAAP
jgi:sugar lactone lactonase YvrE